MSMRPDLKKSMFTLSLASLLLILSLNTEVALSTPAEGAGRVGLTDKPSGNQGWEEGFGSAVNGTIRAIVVNGSDVYVAGDFSMAGGVAATRIARWDGVQWHPLGSGLNRSVYTLTINGNNVYAGGLFTTAGGVSARYVARWDGSQWHPMGSGANTVVFTLVADGDSVYAGGGFTVIGGVYINRIARWDGSQWHPLGGGVNSYVQSIVVKGKTVYAGGNFVSAGGSPVKHVARWDGTQWHPVGEGVTDPAGSPVVYALALMGDDLYMAGGFFYADRRLVNGVARWDGTQWHPMGGGLSSIGAQTLTVSGDRLYVGGGFDYAGGVAVNKAAMWGCHPRIACIAPRWSALETGMNDNVFALKASNGKVYTGGDFTTAGGTSSERFGIWHETP